MLYNNHTIHYFYPRSPCGERQQAQGLKISPHSISIHALLAESDARRASRQQPAGISIHALLAESDGVMAAPITPTYEFLSTLSLRRATLGRSVGLPVAGHFYPRSPCGERRFRRRPVPRNRNFYPRSPCGERPAHTPTAYIAPHFYPRSPCGERRVPVKNQSQGLQFLSTLSLRRATIKNPEAVSKYMIFLSTLSLRRATSC